MQLKSNILVFGLLSTGSSALVDLFREYNNIHIIPGEFNDFRAPGLVADQLSFQQSIDFPNRIDELTKFKIKIKLINNIIPIRKLKIHAFNGIRKRQKNALLRIRQINLLKKLNKELKSKITYSEKIQFAKKWITDIGNLNRGGKEFVVFDQPLLTGVDSKIWSEVFCPWKLICVFRDPKDQLAEIIKKDRLFLPFGAPYVNLAGVIIETIYGRNRKGAMNIHTDAIKKRLEWVDSLKETLDPDKFLLIDFEGLVNNYDKYKPIIENFIGDIKQNHTKKMTYFDPMNATKSIGIYKEYLTSEEIASLSELENWYCNMVYSNLIFHS